MVQAVEAVEAVPPEQAGALAAVVVDDPRGAFQGGERGFAISETYFLIWAMCDACVHEVILRRQSLDERNEEPCRSNGNPKNLSDHVP